MNIVNNPVINEIANKILDNKQFKDACNKNITDILKDGKLDIDDTHYILTLVVDIFNEYPNINITKDKIVGVFKVIVVTILNDLDLLNEGNREAIEKLIESGLKLLITKVKQSNSLDRFIYWIKKSCSCSNTQSTSIISNNLNIPVESVPDSRSERVDSVDLDSNTVVTITDSVATINVETEEKNVSI